MMNYIIFFLIGAICGAGPCLCWAVCLKNELDTERETLETSTATGLTI
jgi:hypothetical protein